MARLIVSVVLVVALVAGILFFLSGRAGEQPTSRVEKAVELGNLAS